MRIISGTYKGKRLQAPKNLPTRPTTDFAKEALFNILTNRYDFETLKVLDLFAGIGSISFEFASRGAQQILGVEKNVKCVQFIQQTMEQLEFQDQMQVLKQDVFGFLKQSYHQKYNIVFADPPYDLREESYQKLINSVLEQWLEEEGVFILEHSKHLKLSQTPNLKETRKYGNVNFSFLST